MNRQWLLLIALLFAGNLFAQNECKLFFPYEEGVAFEITHYDKKDRLSSVTYNEVDVIEETDQVNKQISHINAYSNLIAKLNAFYQNMGLIKNEKHYKKAHDYFFKYLPQTKE